ncbi:MAG: glycosyltransferase family 39 protein [Patescibacteria group bacterium]|nr:glycosyltransferase family 39 protein [Patescibacteria group bacterium]
MKLLKKYKKEILIGLLLLIAYLVMRLVNLTALPIFTDEAIYLRWAQIAKNDANWRFISLTDGKQPLYVWLAMVFMKVIKDPLTAGRLVSVASGIFGMFFLGLLSWEIFRDKKVAFLASILYLVYPFTLFYDRMALMDGLLAVTTIVTLYLEIRLVREIRLDLALLTGMAMGAAMLVKTSGFFTLYLAPLLLLFFDFSRKDWVKSFIKLIFFGLISAVLSQVYYAVLRLSPLYHMIAEKDTTFVYPVKEWLTHPFTFFQGNLTGMTDWAIHYLSWPLAFVIIIALILSLKKYFRERWFLFLWFLAPFVALALFGKVLYPRFILFMTMPLLVLIASGLSVILGSEAIPESKKNRFWTQLRKSYAGQASQNDVKKIFNKKVRLFLIFLFLLPSLLFDYKILFDIKSAPLTQIDRGQYVDDWPAGWGVKEANAYLTVQAQKGKISVFTDGTFGLMPYAVELYLVYNKNVTIKGLWPLTDVFPKDITESAEKMPTYFIANQKSDIPANWPLRLLGKWQKGNNKDASLRLYKVVLPVFAQQPK